MDDSRAIQAAKHVEFDRLSEECLKASRECEDAYTIWWRTAERLKQIERQRRQAWLELIESSMK